MGQWPASGSSGGAAAREIGVAEGRVECVDACVCGGGAGRNKWIWAPRQPLKCTDPPLRACENRPLVRRPTLASWSQVPFSYKKQRPLIRPVHTGIPEWRTSPGVLCTSPTATQPRPVPGLAALRISGISAAARSFWRCSAFPRILSRIGMLLSKPGRDLNAHAGAWNQSLSAGAWWSHLTSNSSFTMNCTMLEPDTLIPTLGPTGSILGCDRAGPLNSSVE
jgi:hypothetical protein